MHSSIAVGGFEITVITLLSQAYLWRFYGITTKILNAKRIYSDHRITALKVVKHQIPYYRTSSYFQGRAYVLVLNARVFCPSWRLISATLVIDRDVAVGVSVRGFCCTNRQPTPNKNKTRNNVLFLSCLKISWKVLFSNVNRIPQLRLNLFLWAKSLIQ